MDRASISRIEEWDSRPVSGGYVGLNELADSGFTGAVESGGTRLLMLNGRVVGVFDGTISAFEGGDPTAYEAPDPSLPLLLAMKERGGEVRGKYYTDDTPLREVDETLTSGGFTGYLELAENVLSGDYYVVYYGGRSLSAAFVGNEGRVVTGEEAFDLASDEVGIYEVRSVDLEVLDVPEPTEDAVAAAAGAEPADEEPAQTEEESEDADAGDEAAEEDDESAEPASAAEEEPAAADDEPTEEDDEAASDDETTPESNGAESDDEEEPVETIVEEAEDEPVETDAEPVEETDATEPTDAETAAATSNSDDRSESAPGATASSGASTPAPSPRREPPRSEPDERFEEEARWREARTVPALDPEESEQVVERPAQPADRTEQPAARPAPSPNDAATVDVEAVQQRIERLEAELEASEHERRRLTDRLEDVVEDRDEIETERATLADRIESLESRIEQAEAAAAKQPAASQSASAPSEPSTTGSSVDPETALNQTDLFVRYGSKGKATLQTAHDGQASAGEVAENLRIEKHSRFDAATATVGGRPFDAYLEGTIQYRFVAWLVEVLLYEIQETGTEAGLRDLYDVLPRIDRAEFNGTVVHRDEEGEEHRETFDVICRDRMGKPLVVANINDSLDPATGDMMAKLVEDGTAAGEAHESMGAAFLVTASFFQPDALETAADATRGGGFLSRDSKKSYVKLARNGGYHLCLVEARGDDFHVAVPEF